jgi:glycosyltransferase 2 family protein
MLKKVLIFLLKLVLTGSCLIWALSQVDLSHSVFTRPGAVDYRWMAGGVVMAGLTVVLTALRWRLYLLAQGVDPGLRRAIELTLIGNLFNLLSIGGIGGDAARVLLLIRDHPGKKLAVTMAVLVDHLAGMVALAGMFFIVSVAKFDALVNQSHLGKGVIHFAWVYLSGGLGLVLLCFIAACPPVHRRIHANGREWKWKIMRQIPETYDVYRRKWPLALAGVGVSFVMLLAYFMSFWCGLRAVGGTASAGTVLSAMPVIDSLSSLPISVAGVGVREKLFEILMRDLAGTLPEISVAASLVGFACSVIWALVGGLLFLRKGDRVSVAELECVDQKVEEGT